MPIKIGKVLNFIYIPVSVPKKYFVEVEYIEYKKIEVFYLNGGIKNES